MVNHTRFIDSQRETNWLPGRIQVTSWGAIFGGGRANYNFASISQKSHKFEKNFVHGRPPPPHHKAVMCHQSFTNLSLVAEPSFRPSLCKSNVQPQRCMHRSAVVTHHCSALLPPMTSPCVNELYTTGGFTVLCTHCCRSAATHCYSHLHT